MIHARRAVIAAFVLACCSAFAQVKETVSVNVIEVPVTVVDSAGNPVRGLTKENFKLLDQGKNRAITSFDVIDLASAEGQASINPAARHTFLILFDLSNSTPKALTRAQDAARKFISGAVKPLDLVGVGTIDVEHGFRLLTGFTSDREVIELAMKNPAAFASADPLQLSHESKVVTLDTSGRQNADMEQTAFDQRGGNVRVEGVATQKFDNMRSEADASFDSTRQMESANDRYLRTRVEREVDYLGALAQTLRGVPGRKQIIFLSEGFEASVLSGRDARSSAQMKVDNDDALHGDISRVDNDQRYGTTTSQKFLTDMVQYFRGSDVVLHAIDIQGVRVQNDLQSGSTINSNAGLGLLASPTGGLVFQNANRIDENFARMLRAQEVVYVLGFQASSSKPGTFHPLDVKLNNVKVSAHVTARGGYYEGVSMSAQDKTFGIASIIMNDVPQSGVHLDAFVAPFATDGGNSQVPVVLDIFGGDIVRGARTSKTPLEIYVYAFDDKGAVRDRIYQRIAIDTDHLREKLYDSGVKFYATLSVPPGKYAIKTLVRMPESENRGFVRTNITVPDHNTLALLPPVFIDAAARWVMVKGTSHPENVPYPFHLGATEFVPAAAARVRSGETPQFALFVQNAVPDDLTIETKPLAKFVGATSGDGNAVFLLQLDDVDPKIATLDITVHKKGVAEAQTMSVKLEP